MKKHPYKTYKKVPQVKSEIKEINIVELIKDLDAHLKNISIRNRKYFS